LLWKRALPFGSRLNVGIRWIAIVAIFGGYFVLRHFIFGGRSIHIDVWNHPFQPFVSLLYGLQTTVTPFIDLRYEPPFDVWFSRPLTILSAAALVASINVVAKLERPVILAAIFWLVWFVLLQLPTAHFVAEQEAPFSERYVALAALGFSATVATFISQSRRLKITPILASAWIVALALISYCRAGFYADDFAFDSQWELTNPRSSVAHSSMGVAYEKIGRTDNAIAEYNAALACNPNDWTANDNLGVILLHRGQYWPAERHLRIVIAADIHDPQIMVNYGITLEMISIQEKNIPFRNAARKWFEHAIKVNPAFANAHYELAKWHQRFGDPGIARKEMQTALALDPSLKKLDPTNSSF
jgi:tetratricopeptide (TPR) repeat protein